MIFRAAIDDDFTYLASHSINTKADRKQFETIDYNFTLEHEGNPLAMGGFRMIVPTTAWCWIDLTHDAGKNIRTVYRVTIEWMNQFAKDNNIKRLQAFIRMDSPEAIRLAQHLGFSMESIMKNFYGDDDAYLYTRIF